MNGIEEVGALAHGALRSDDGDGGAGVDEHEIAGTDRADEVHVDLLDADGGAHRRRARDVDRDHLGQACPRRSR